jgi:serine/threonine-protein kinase
MDKIKDYLFKNFEQTFVLVILVGVAGISFLVPYKLAFLNFYFLPVLLTAYYLDVKRALLGAILCILLVGFFFYRDPASFDPGNSFMDLSLNLVTWAGFLILSAAIVGSLSQKVHRELTETVALQSKLTTTQAQAAETNKTLGLSFQGQGMLDLAFDKFQMCPLDEPMKNIVYNLALDFERKRYYEKAVVVLEHIEKADPAYKDLRERKELLKKAAQGNLFGDVIGGAKGGTARFALKPTLGRYEIEKELGRGAMGIVYLGRDPKINRQVAIKTLALDDSMGSQAIADTKERFYREAHAAGTLNHPNIVRIFDAGEEHDVCYITMELLEGQELTGFTAQGSLLSPQRVLRCVAQAADALEHAHSQGIIHRDIKPANLMLLKDDSIRVADFGIARIIATSKTATGVSIGTPAYMSPEQLTGAKVDGRADIFSLGVVLFELLTGQRPFEEGEGVASLLFRIVSDPEPEPCALNPGVPPCASKIVHKALMKSPEGRYQTGAQMAAALRACAAFKPGEAEVAAGPEISRPERES